MNNFEQKCITIFMNIFRSENSQKITENFTYVHLPHPWPFLVSAVTVITVMIHVNKDTLPLTAAVVLSLYFCDFLEIFVVQI